MYAQPILIDLPESIETSRLLLKAPKAGYGQNLHEAIIDGYDDGIKWLNWPSLQPSIEEIEKDCRKHHSEFILRDFIRYLIIEKDSNLIVGRCALPAIYALWQIPQFAISYFIRKSARNKGYAREAMHALTLITFQLLKAKKIEIVCDADNIASQKVPQELGYILEYSKKGGWPKLGGELADLHIYSIFSEDALPKWNVKW